ncbi:hypothetical protein BDZ91DRAFT_781917 [Kalaharituber pfeilii]|nr:hypothetical protein BDZ91DRAFT_781917 [Kalaharituber pfeilii]
MTPDEVQSHIYRILETHDIPLSRQDISWAFTSDKTAAAVVDYAERYLGRENLLGLEESEIYEHIKTTHLLKLHKSRDLSLVHPPTDEILRLEIEGLRASTENYRQQTEVLKRQKEGLQMLRKREMHIAEGKRKLRERRRKKLGGERERLIAEIENLVVTLRHHITDLRQWDKGQTAAAVGTGKLVDINAMKDLFANDDKVLAKLERLAEETPVGAMDDSSKEDVIKRMRMMTARLAYLHITTIRTRLDRVFLETLNCPPALAPPEDPSHSEYLQALKSDLESLDTEIPAVAKMSSEAEFLKPVVGEWERRKGVVGEVVRGRGGYIRDVLNHLAARNTHAVSIFSRDIHRQKTLHSLSALLDQLSHFPLPGQSSINPTTTTIDGTRTPPRGVESTKLPILPPRTPGRSSTSPTKHLPPHLRMQPVTPKRSDPTSSYTPLSTRRRRRGRRRPGPREPSHDDEDVDMDEDEEGDEESADPALDLLLHLGISLPSDLSLDPAATKTGVGFGGKEIHAHLLRQLIQLRTRVTQQEETLQRSLKTAVRACISEGAGVGGIIRGIESTDRPYGIAPEASRSLALEGTLQGLLLPGTWSEELVMRKLAEVEREVEKMSGAVQKVVQKVEELKETEGAGAGMGGVEARVRFVGRWGR